MRVCSCGPTPDAILRLIRMPAVAKLVAQLPTEGGLYMQPSYYDPTHGQPAPAAHPTVDAGKLWAGGLATAIVAALIAVLGIVIARGIFDVPVLAPKESGSWGNASTGTYALAAFGAALVATGLMHLLMLTTPSPFQFFAWIILLFTAVAAAAPFATGATLAAQVATAVINALIGLAIFGLTESSARRSIVHVRHALPPPTM